MTIKGLSKFLKTRAPEAYDTIELSSLSGSFIAVDAHNWMYKRMGIAHKYTVNKTNVLDEEPDREETIKNWLSSAIDFIISLLQQNIMPIFVFDGEARKLKEDTHEKRKQRTDRVKERLSEVNNKIDELGIDVTTDLIEEKKKIMRALTYVSGDEFEMLIDLLTSCGLPMLIAQHDAEELCCMLAIEGRVSAVFSSDTDCIAFGAPLILTQFNGRYAASTIVTSKVLSCLNLSYEDFADLCILSGCDFNNNIKGYGVGKCYKDILQCGSVNNIPIVKEKGEECLRLDVCREIFSYKSSMKLIRDGSFSFNLDVLNEMGRDVLLRYDIENKFSSLHKLVLSFSPSNDKAISVSPYSYELEFEDEDEDEDESDQE
jgi:flap endonuclease-1